jgi:hypothetical protein
MLHNTFTLSTPDQTNLLPALTPEGLPWVCLTRATTAKAALVERLPVDMVGVHVHTFKHGSLSLS